MPKLLKFYGGLVHRAEDDEAEDELQSEEGDPENVASGG